MSQGELKISLIFSEICQKQGIDFVSQNENYLVFEKDAFRLRDIYCQLKEIAADLYNIEERHGVDGLAKILQDTIDRLEEVDHSIMKLAYKIKNDD